MSTETPSTDWTHYNLSRDGKPPLRFTGKVIGYADNHSHQGPNQNRWTIVRIYRTKGGKIIVQVTRRTQWQGESDGHSSESFTTAKEAIAWLTEDNGGHLGSVSQEALDQAAKADAEFAAAYVEEVE